MTDPIPCLEAALAPHGFRRVKPGRPGCRCQAILKLQTLNLNRAVAVVALDELPRDPTPLLKGIKREVAWRAGFFPFFYGIGTQLVLVVRDPVPPSFAAERFVDRHDNQWSIIQSVFLVHPDAGLVATARTWGQRISGKYQDAIEAALTAPAERDASRADPPRAGER